MKDYSKYAGIIPAFYACYDEKGDISPKAVRELTEYYIQKGVKGLYVGGSSGECIYQTVAERKLLLENVMAVAKGKLTIIAHVACNNTRDSMELAAHAESVGVDAIAAIPPSTSTCPTGPLPNTGMTFPPPLPTPTSSSTTFPSWQALP